MLVRPRYLAPLVLIGLFSCTVLAQDILDPLKDLDFSKTSLKSTQIQKLEIYELKLLRGIIFGRHGRVFKDSEIKGYLDEQPWYKANSDFNNSMLNDVERRNLDLIRIAEASRHETIQPGDMRYWRESKLFTESVSTTSRGYSSIWKSVTGTFQATSTTRRSSRQSSARTFRY